MLSGRMRARLGGVGKAMWAMRSAEPDLEVEARLPCLERRSREEARMEAVVEMLKVLWASPPVPTMSHWIMGITFSRQLCGGIVREERDRERDRERQRFGGCICAGRRGRKEKKSITYETAHVSALFSAPCGYHLAQKRRVDLRSGLKHLLCALAQHHGVAVEPREVQAHEQRAGLHIVDAVREEERDGVGDLLGCDGGGGGGGLLRRWPEAAQEVFDVDDGRRLGGPGGGFDQVGLGGRLEGRGGHDECLRMCVRRRRDAWNASLGEEGDGAGSEVETLLGEGSRRGVGLLMRRRCVTVVALLSMSKKSLLSNRN